MEREGFQTYLNLGETFVGRHFSYRRFYPRLLPVPFKVREKENSVKYRRIEGNIYENLIKHGEREREFALLSYGKYECVAA